MRLFYLTPLTRGARSRRRVVVKGFDLPARALLIAVVALVPAIPLTAMAWAVVGEMGVLAIPVVELAVFVLVEARSRQGLRLRLYQSLNDKRRAKQDLGKFIVAGRELDPLGDEWGVVGPGSAPAPGTLP